MICLRVEGRGIGMPARTTSAMPAMQGGIGARVVEEHSIANLDGVARGSSAPGSSERRPSRWSGRARQSDRGTSSLGSDLNNQYAIGRASKRLERWDRGQRSSTAKVLVSYAPVRWLRGRSSCQFVVSGRFRSAPIPRFGPTSFLRCNSDSTRLCCGITDNGRA